MDLVDNVGSSLRGIQVVQMIRRLCVVALAACVFVGLAGCSVQQRLSAPIELGDGWRVGTLAEARLNEAAITQLTRDIKNGEFPNTHALLIEHEGRLVYEQYFPGTDELWGKPVGYREIHRDSLHDVRSISKAVTSAVLGIALGSSFEEAVQTPIVSYFPGLETSPGLEAVTLHHALTMTAGLEWNEMGVPYTDPSNDEIRLYAYDVKDPVAYVLSRPLRDPPGSVWYYNGGLAQVLAGIVQRLTGKPLDTYAQEVLFTPLGTTDFAWLRGPSWNPPMPAAASGLRMRARDLAKIGSLHLHAGRWNGKQVIPAEWVELSTRRHVNEVGHWSSGGVWGYGYQWWIGRFPGGYEVIAAVGNGNQRVFVVSKERLVVTIFAGEYNKFEGHSERILARILAAR